MTEELKETEESLIPAEVKSKHFSNKEMKFLERNELK